MTRILLGRQLEQATEGMDVEITGAELHYLKNVRRHSAGDTVLVVDRSGSCFNAQVLEIGSDAAIVHLLQEVMNGAAALPVHILAAVPREKILDDVVRKLSELGVSKFTPLICERSSVVPGPQRLERWQRIAEQSMRQCRRRTELTISLPIKFDDALECIEEPHRFILDPDGNVAGGALLKRRIEGAVAMMIGPEGGFTPRELTASAGALFQPVQFGNSIMRMETAILVASVTCVAMLGGYDG
ncbi:MAG: 16S rRNA (uracil(1498)-N(3))-methyltransferase [Deltaproteobacteria bacterium]|nr:16S rRNA (uracil(1498)-N(3))-methyltransferase [Deltaproteobacteria bacterium]